MQSAIGFSFFVLFGSTICPYSFLSTMPRKTRAHRTSYFSSESPSRIELFKDAKSREAFDKLNSKRKIWAEHSVILDEVDLAIRANFESRGWLSLLEIDHPPPTALIRVLFEPLL